MRSSHTHLKLVSFDCVFFAEENISNANKPKTLNLKHFWIAACLTDGTAIVNSPILFPRTYTDSHVRGKPALANCKTPLAYFALLSYRSHNLGDLLPPLRQNLRV